MPFTEAKYEVGVMVNGVRGFGVWKPSFFLGTTSLNIETESTHDAMFGIQGEVDRTCLFVTGSWES